MIFLQQHKLSTSPSRKSLAGRNLALVLVMAMSANLAYANNNNGIFARDDEEKKVFTEDTWETPPAPSSGDMLEFYQSTLSKQKFAIDSKSLQIGKDDVLRYTLIATSSSGAKNISYEGIRCDTYEKKLYAFANADGTWTKARNSEWTAIANKGPNIQHASLAKFFCENTMIAGTVKQILYNIRYPRPTGQE